MKLVAAYLLLTVGGNTSPSAEDVKKLLSTVGIEADDSRLNKLIEELNGKNVDELIAQGTEKLASVPSASAAAAPAAGGAAPAAAAEEAPKKEEAKEESDDDMGLGEFVPFNKIAQECDNGCVEYKLKLSLSTPKDRIDRYITQMKYRLLEGRGRCLYQIGVLDDGHLIGIDDSGIRESVECLKHMASELGAAITVQRILSVSPLPKIKKTPQKTKSRSINDGIEPSEPLSLQEQQHNQSMLQSLLEKIHADSSDDDIDHLFHSDEALVSNDSDAIQDSLMHTLHPSTQSTTHKTAQTTPDPANMPPDSRHIVMTPDEFDLPYQDITLQSGEYKIKAYLIAPPASVARSRPTVILFHANAGNMGHRLPLAQVFYHRYKTNVLMVSYRGYGKSEGMPSERGIRSDARAALEFVQQHTSTQNTKVILYGQSIGGAVCIDLAKHYPDAIHALILENTFTSIPQLIPSLLPLLTPFTFLCTEHWNSAQSIRSIGKHTHTLFLSGTMDEIVPVSHMRILYNTVVKGRKEGAGDVLCRWKSFPNGTHNDTCVSPDYWDSIADFLQDIDSKPEPLEWSYEEISKQHL
ncbi:hypothetical protein E3P99_03550 [Wallemia hederae]|uniref:Serine aminopeptidase S33 domain-containing protein n=1 Tax=Wallemia hederae TaxID=1540922 RepID=A0A4T0FFK2_9BASI|nr:hypothetical protein E3P99_03550 [Wallemia hederae]